MVDIGAHIGDTTLPMAVAARGGTVVAIEMGPPVELLKINAKLNPHFKIDVHNIAITNHSGGVVYESDCQGCNGKISTKVNGTKVKSARLYPFLAEKYSAEFLENICLIKTDTEGHDQVILADLDPRLRPGVIWVEWFAGYHSGSPSHCTTSSAKLFKTAKELGYQIYQPRLPLRNIGGCENRFYENDLLLIKTSKALEIKDKL